MVRSSQEGVFAESSSVCYPEQTDALLGQPLMQVLPQPGLAGPVQPLPSTAYMQQQYHHLHTGPSTARETVSQAIFFLFCFWHFARVKGKPSDSFFFFFSIGKRAFKACIFQNMQNCPLLIFICASATNASVLVPGTILLQSKTWEGRGQ